METTKSKPGLEQARAYANAEYGRRATTIEGYRTECLEYVKVLKKAYSITPEVETGLVSAVTTKPPIEVWKSLNRVWLANTKTIPLDAVKQALYKDIEEVGDVSAANVVLSKILEIHVGNAAPVSFETTTNPWLKEARPHYEVLISTLKEKPCTYQMTRGERWLVVRVMLEDYREKMGMPPIWQQKNVEPRIRTEPDEAYAVDPRNVVVPPPIFA